MEAAARFSSKMNYAAQLESRFNLFPVEDVRTARVLLSLSFTLLDSRGGIPKIWLKIIESLQNRIPNEVGPLKNNAEVQPLNESDSQTSAVFFFFGIQWILSTDKIKL